MREDFKLYVLPFMKYADIIIPGGADNSTGFQFILDNLRSYQKKIARQEGSKKENSVQSAIVSEKDVKEFNSTAISYEFDPNNSHSALMIEGLTIKFTMNFFK